MQHNHASDARSQLASPITTRRICCFLLCPQDITASPSFRDVHTCSSSSARPIPVHSFKPKLNKCTSPSSSRIARPITHRAQSQQLLWQTNCEATVTATIENIATDRASGNDQAGIAIEIFIPVEEEEGISVLLVARGDGPAESHVHEFVESVKSEDIASRSGGGVAESELRNSWVARGRDFASIGFRSGSGVVVESEAGWGWAREGCCHCGPDCGGADMSGNVRNL